MHEETTTEQHMEKKNKLDEENNDTNMNSYKTQNETENDKMKNAKHNSASEAINNNAKWVCAPIRSYVRMTLLGMILDCV